MRKVSFSDHSDFMSEIIFWQLSRSLPNGFSQMMRFVPEFE